MTLSKLARLANVSVSVVSKAFSGREDVSEAMREHVFAVAREYGCFQQFYHAPYDKPVIAVIIPEAISQYYIHYIEALKRSMEQNGYTMLLSISNFDRQLASELAHYYAVHSKVDGLLMISGANALPQNTTTAIVSFSAGEKENETGVTIHYDMHKGLARAIRYLKENGHQRIGYVGEPFTASKCDILCQEMERAGIEPCREWIVNSRLRFEEAGIDGVRRIWRCEEKPTVIIGAYGYITQGILRELSRMGLEVPRDVSVLSLDNDPYPLHPTLDVSCIPSGIEVLCEQVMRILGERMRTPHPNMPAHILLSADFHAGKTIKKLN